MIFYKNINKKKVGIAVLMSDKVDFKETKCKRSRRALCSDRGILIRTRYNIFFYMYAPNRGVLKDMNLLTIDKRKIWQ